MTTSKKLRFAGSSVGEPWWIIGHITRRLLEPLGYDVEVLSESGSTNNPRYVGSGRAELGATVPQTLGWAVRGEHLYKGETFVPLRAVGRVHRPSWLTAAVRWELGLTSLQEISESDYPIRLVTHDLASIASVVPQEVLKHYRLTKDQIEARGGTVREIGRDFRSTDFDLIIGNLYMGRSAVTRHWSAATEQMNLRFLDLDDALLARLEAEGHGTRGEVPYHFLRGVDRWVKALDRVSDLLIYLPESTDQQFVYDLTKAYDMNRRTFFGQAVQMAWDPHRVTDGGPLPLHAGAERYYREAGLL